MLLKAAIHRSIQEVPSEQWNLLLGSYSATARHEFWAFIERANLPGFDCRHITFRTAEGELAGLASFYVTTTDAAIFAPPWLKAILQAIRRVFPAFLKFRMLECGTPVTLNTRPPVVAHGIPQHEVTRALHNVLLQAAREERQQIVVIRDFESDSCAMAQDLRALEYHLVDNLPNTYLDIEWATPQGYLDAMQSYYRSKLLRHLRKCADVSYEQVDDFHALADVLCEQWMAVHQRAAVYQREVLTPDFYREFSSSPGVGAKALLFYRKDELIGHALLMLDGELLRWLYVGRKEPLNNSLYIFIAHKVIETAIHLGMRRVELGLTTYSIKQDLGAQLVPVKIALRSPSHWLNRLVGLGYKFFNSTPAIHNKNIFKRNASAHTRDAP